VKDDFRTGKCGFQASYVGNIAINNLRTRTSQGTGVVILQEESADSLTIRNQFTDENVTDMARSPCNNNHCSSIDILGLK
jgi:hypothetical protein